MDTFFNKSMNDVSAQTIVFEDESILESSNDIAFKSQPNNFTALNTFSISPTTVTPATSDNSTKICTTAYVKNQDYITSTTASSTYTPLNRPQIEGLVRINTIAQTGNNAPVSHGLVVSNNLAGSLLPVSSTCLYLSSNVSGCKVYHSYSINGASGFSHGVRCDGTTTPNWFLSSSYNTLNGTDLLTISNTTGAATFAGNVITPDVTLAGSSLVSQLAAKANLASPSFTGTPTAPTPGVGVNSTQIATTAYVKNQNYATLLSPSFSGTLVVNGSINGSLISIRGTDCLFIGYNFASLGTHLYNTIIGVNNMDYSSTINANGNTIVGCNNLNTVSGTSNSNTLVGTNILPLYTQQNTTWNTVVGRDACSAKLTGARVSAFGGQAGSNNKYGDNNTFLGSATSVSNTDLSYTSSTAIGYGAVITDSYQIVLGRSTESVYIPGYMQPSYIHVTATNNWVAVTNNFSFSVNLPTGMSYDVEKPYTVKVLFRVAATNDAPSSTSPVFDITGQNFNTSYDNGFSLTWYSATQLRVRTGDAIAALTYNHTTNAYTSYSTGYYKILIY